MVAVNARQMGGVDRALLRLDGGALGALYRGIVGFATLPTMSLLMGNDRPDWALVPFLLVTLLMLRIVPLAVRRSVPFSQVLRDAWAMRRRIAKRYDSYQWRKLLWIGGGLGLYLALSDELSIVPVAVCTICLLAGAAGTARWYAVSAHTEVAGAPVTRAGGAA